MIQIPAHNLQLFGGYSVVAVAQRPSQRHRSSTQFRPKIMYEANDDRQSLQPQTKLGSHVFARVRAFFGMSNGLGNWKRVWQREAGCNTKAVRAMRAGQGFT